MVICNAYYLEKRKGVNIEMKIAACGKGGYRIKEKQITQL